MGDDERKLAVNPDPLRSVPVRGPVPAGLPRLSREARLANWIATGGTEDDFPYPDEWTPDVEAAIDRARGEMPRDEWIGMTVIQYLRRHGYLS